MQSKHSRILLLEHTTTKQLLNFQHRNKNLTRESWTFARKFDVHKQMNSGDLSSLVTKATAYREKACGLQSEWLIWYLLPSTPILP